MKNKKILMLTECAMMIALSTVLSLVKVIEMPMGGSVTLFSMLPVIFIGIKQGTKSGLITGFLFSIISLLFGIASGNVFPYCQTSLTVVIVVLFDYIVPFTFLGFSGILKKYSFKGIYAGAVLTLFIRFLCHFFTGVTVWKQWAPDGMSKYIYSLTYNGSYMLVEFIMTMTALVILVQIPQIRKIVGITDFSQK